jgi:hypothetical protein
MQWIKCIVTLQSSGKIDHLFVFLLYRWYVLNRNVFFDEQDQHKRSCLFLIQFKNPPPLVVVMFFGAMPKFDNFAK